MRIEKRFAVSELYASMLMIGVTLSFGSVVTFAAVSQFNLSAGSAALAGSLQQASSGKQVSLVYAAVTPGSGGCAAVYRGVTEGKAYTVTLFNYGSQSFTPSEIVVNSTVYTSSYPAIMSGTMMTYSLSLTMCTHPSGQTVLLSDIYGDEVQVGT